MGAVIFSLDKAENPELCRSIMRNFLTQDRLKRGSIESSFILSTFLNLSEQNFANNHSHKKKPYRETQYDETPFFINVNS